LDYFGYPKHVNVVGEHSGDRGSSAEAKNKDSIPGLVRFHKIAVGLPSNGRAQSCDAPVRVLLTLAPRTTRPNPYVGNGVTWFDQGTSSYHSLNVSLLKRVTHGLAFKANYTYAKVMDLNSAILAPSAGNEPPDVFSPYNLKLNRGIASYSLHHQFNANFSYQLPFGSGQRFASGAGGVVDKLIGGWQWNGIVSVQGGFPFTPLAGSNISGTGDSNQSDTPDWNPNFKGPVILGTADHWYDPRAFQLPIAGTFGNVARGSLRGPRLTNVDTSFFKKIRISERLNLQFRAEAFNILNHPNFAFPNEIVFQGNGYSSSAGSLDRTATFSRQIQFALKPAVLMWWRGSRPAPVGGTSRAGREPAPRNAPRNTKRPLDFRDGKIYASSRCIGVRLLGVRLL